MNKNTIVTSILSVVFVLVFLCLGVGTVVFKGFIDFPCFVYYDETNSCIIPEEMYPGVDPEKRIQVFLDVTRLGLSGAGCHAEGSFTDVLEFRTPATKLKFERKDNLLYVNGDELSPGERFISTNYFNLNPWTVESIEFINYGAIPVCDSESPPQIYVIGSYKNEVSLFKALLIFVVCLTVIFRISYRVKSNKIS